MLPWAQITFQIGEVNFYIHVETCLPVTRNSVLLVVVVVVVVGQTVGSISSKTLAYDCLYTLEFVVA